MTEPAVTAGAALSERTSGARLVVLVELSYAQRIPSTQPGAADNNTAA